MWPPRATIPRRDGAPKLYRHYLLGRGNTYGVFLHHFVASDDADEMHDHPWRWALAIVLAGTYRETRLTPHGTPRTRTLTRASLNLIRGSDFHRVDLPNARPAWTLFIHAPTTKPWSFLNLATHRLTQWIRPEPT